MDKLIVATTIPPVVAVAPSPTNHIKQPKHIIVGRQENLSHLTSTLEEEEKSQFLEVTFLQFQSLFSSQTPLL